MIYRPWGPIDWVLSLSEQAEWHFIGVLGTEERSLCSWAYLRSRGAISSELFAQIHDIESDKYRDQTRIALEARRTRFNDVGGNFINIRELEIMTELFQINNFALEAGSLGSSVILDITSFPKRFFFPLLKALVVNENVKNLLLTYTSPESYAEGELYEDIEQLRTLPGFGGDGSTPEIWIVSVGFLVESLRKHVGDNPDEIMKILIPFPAPLAVLKRTWTSVANLEQGHHDSRFEKFRVETLDISAAFDRIYSLSSNPLKKVAFAPFGPKPISAAMCLYSIQRDSPVFYSQPTVYNPGYSIGIRNNDPLKAVSAYWVKYNGDFFYSTT